MAKKYEYHKRNDYPGERIDERKRVADAKADATDRADGRVAYANSVADDRYDNRVAIDNNRLAAKGMADQDRYNARVSVDNKRYNEEVDRNRVGNGAAWLIGACLLVIAILALGLILWNPWYQPAATAIPNTQTNFASPTLALTQVPTYGAVGQLATIKWDIDGSTATITNTEVYFGSSSVSNPALSGYPSMTPAQCTSVACTVPSSFSAQLNLDKPGSYYYRVSAVVDGTQYWSNEVNVKVISDVQTPQEFSMIANSYGFYESNHATNTIAVKIGQPVELTLFVMNSGAVSTNLEFKGCGQDTGMVAVGNQVGAVMYFTPVEGCTISSYTSGGDIAQTLTVKMV